jgi:hypothetical protein
MNHEAELVTRVKDSYANARLTATLEETINRGRAMRRHRRLAIAAGTAALVAVAVTTGVALTVDSTGAPTTPIRLTAWTVTREPSHVVKVTIRQLDNPSGLQRALGVDGIPARVAFTGQVATNAPLPQGCSAPAISDERNAKLQGQIVLISTSAPKQGIALIIRGSAIPRGIGLYLTIQRGSSASSWGYGLDLVNATPRCTGP